MESSSEAVTNTEMLVAHPALSVQVEVERTQTQERC